MPTWKENIYLVVFIMQNQNWDQSIVFVVPVLKENLIDYIRILHIIT